VELERLLAGGTVDGLALGRPLVADPDLPNKIRSGQAELVVQCGGCLQGCLAGVKSGKGIACIVNPELGREGVAFSVPSTTKRVVIVGGGPAGMMAARVAADRGHKVMLLERSPVELGGQFSQSHLAPGKQAMRRTLDSFLRWARASGADVRMGSEATVDGIVELAPDVVLIASGAEPIIPNIPGLTQAITGQRILAGAADVGPRVLIIGGGLVGVEVAEYLAERGHEVVVVEMLEELARDMEPITRKLTFKRLENLPVTLYSATKVTRVAEGYTRAEGPEGERDLGAFDTVVVATGTRPLDVLSRELRARGIEVHIIGDAGSIGQVQGATTSAWDAAARL
jgi:NADPH-dependent 2,4-dienoyl-CoA reductase/sulfur reductase-like enzyme